VTVLAGIALASLAGWIGVLVGTARAWDLWPIAEDEPGPSEPPSWPSVAVIVPARNEAEAVLPETLAGVAFLSGGQSPEVATTNLAAMQKHETPWPLTCAFGRALVDPALKAWHGDPALISAGQQALISRVQPNSAAVA
jgi:hypothetical protein